MKRANVFAVDAIGRNPVITSGMPVVFSGQWQVPLGECIGCGADQVLRLSVSSPPEVIPGNSPNTGRILHASVGQAGTTRTLRRPHEVSLRAIVMFTFDGELKPAPGESIYSVAQGTGTVIELYRGQRIQFRCEGIEYEMTYNGASLICERLTPSSSANGILVGEAIPAMS